MGAVGECGGVEPGGGVGSALTPRSMNVKSESLESPNLFFPFSMCTKRVLTWGEDVLLSRSPLCKRFASTLLSESKTYRKCTLTIGEARMEGRKYPCSNVERFVTNDHVREFAY